MDFFAQQERAQKRTTLLVTYFILAVVAIIAAVYAVAIGILIASEEGRAVEWWQPEIFTGVAAGVIIVISLGSLYQIAQLSKGGRVVAGLLGGRLIASNTTNFEERGVLNVVEEMAIASGTMVPPVYVMDKEESINAFAAGFSPNDAVIGVSRGAIQQLSRDELQGVMAHEFSHILRGDMRLNIRLMGLLHGILLLSLIGLILFRIAGEVLRHTPSRRSSNDKDSGNGIMGLVAVAFVAGVALYIIGYVGEFFGKLIKAAVSRQREYLADAASVQFTRNPLGITGALKKIGGASSRLAAPYADEAAHLFFANALRQGLIGLLATHPPLDDRIRRIDPKFDGRFPTLATAATASTDASQASHLASSMADNASGVATAELMNHIGHPTEEHLQYAAALRQEGWGSLDAWIHDAYSSSALIFALLISSEEATARRQFDELRKRVNPGLIEAVERVLPLVASLDRSHRLPLVEIATSPLLQLSKQQYQQFTATLKMLAEVDGQVSLFEFALLRLLLLRLQPNFGQPPRRVVRYKTVESVWVAAATLIGAIAQAGTPAPDESEQAFKSAMNVLGVDAPPDLRPGSLSLDDVNVALGKLAEAAPNVKRQLIAACAACITHDGRTTLDEAELLRVVCASLDCPLPPVIGM